MKKNRQPKQYPRLTHPLVRDANRQLRQASWQEALERTAAGFRRTRDAYGPPRTPAGCVSWRSRAATPWRPRARGGPRGMSGRTDTERARSGREVVLELLASSVDLSTTPRAEEWIREYGAEPGRFGAEAARDDEQPKVYNDLYVRDYDRCIICYKCVDACGEQWQNTFAIAAAGRGFDARISTEHDAPLTDSACVYCGNCIEVCPTGALSFKSEYDMRAAGTWDEAAQTETTTVCAYCGAGCNPTLRVQDNEIVKVTSPHDNPVTHGNLCIKGRSGFQHVQTRDWPD